MSDNVLDDEVLDDLETTADNADDADDDGDDTDGPDVLSAPRSTTPSPGGRRARIRSSRFGTLVVLLVTAAVVAAGVLLVQQGSSQDRAAQTGGGTQVSLPGLSKLPPPEVGKAAQDFTVTTYDGAKVSLSQFKGKPVWITFGASWCSGCQAEVPDIQAAYTAYKPKGLVLLGISITEDNAAVKAYAGRVGLTYPMAADPDSAVADEYAVSAIPSHFFVDAQGVVRDIRVGSLSPGTMNEILDKLVTP